MIFLTRLDGTQFLLNEDMIETVNETPDTVIALESGHNLIVRESMREIQQLVNERSRQLRRARRHRGASEKPLT